jgi:hydroxymethylglutaryl-CoA synthase
MHVGIERATLATGGYRISPETLAAARGLDMEALLRRNRELFTARTVLAPHEDAVTLAVDAARAVLEGQDTKSVGLLVVATESAVDFGKPVSTWVHRFCELPARCRNFEVKHMCYGGTAALRVAADWVSSSARPGQKALVISADASRPHGHFDVADGALGELGGGGCAVAMVVGAEPHLLALEPGRLGLWTNELSDALRPTLDYERIEGELSFFSYLDALEACLEHYQEVTGPFDFERFFQRNIYHAPFPGMARVAHGVLCERAGLLEPRQVEASFRAQVAPSLHFSRKLGTAYGASPYVGLLGLLHADSNLSGGERVSVFSYGSGCQAEFFSGVLGPEARHRADTARIERALEARTHLSLEQYEAFEQERARSAGAAHFVPTTQGQAAAGRLVLERVENHRRHYVWS